MVVMRKLVYGVHLRSELLGVLASVLVVKTMAAKTMAVKKTLPAAVASDVEGCLAEALWLSLGSFELTRRVQPIKMKMTGQVHNRNLGSVVQTT